jgi:polysaccharide export outer membrane protein
LVLIMTAAVSRSNMNTRLCLLVLLCLAYACGRAQDAPMLSAPPVLGQHAPFAPETAREASAVPPPTAALPLGPASNYVLGPGDEITIRVLDLDEIGDKPFRLDLNGEINVPLAGRVDARGLTTAQLEAELAKRLKAWLLEPKVTASVTQFRSQPVSVLGAVTTPGVLQIENGKTLFQVISLAGGLRPEAGSVIKITRRKEYGPIPLPGAAMDSSGEFSVAEVAVTSVMGAQNPTENIAVRPYDVVSIPTTNVVYVVGSVRRPGGFALGSNENLSVLQAVAKAEGLDKSAAPKKGRILRSAQRGAPTVEVAVNVKAILDGKAADVRLGPNDILFIPATTGLKGAGYRAAEIALSASSYRIMY